MPLTLGHENAGTVAAIAARLHELAYRCHQTCASLFSCENP